MTKRLLMVLAVLGLLVVLVLGGFYWVDCNNKVMRQKDIGYAVTLAFCYRPWEGGARQLSDDRIGAIAAKLDYSHFGVEMQRNPDGFPLDAWGHPLRIRAKPAEGVVGVYSLEVRSAGPDGVLETSDDVVTEGRIPVVYYVFRDRSDAAVAYDFALVGSSILAQKVTVEGGMHVTLYECVNETVQLAIEAEKWKVEPGEDVADGISEEGMLVRATLPADRAEPVRKVCFPDQEREYKEFLVRLREQCMQESRRVDRLPLFVIRDARLIRFLTANWPESALPRRVPGGK